MPAVPAVLAGRHCLAARCSEIESARCRPANPTPIAEISTDSVSPSVAAPNTMGRASSDIEAGTALNGSDAGQFIAVLARQIQGLVGDLVLVKTRKPFLRETVQTQHAVPAMLLPVLSNADHSVCCVCLSSSLRIRSSTPVAAAICW